MPRPIKQAICHPERKHYAQGQCQNCYYKAYKAKHPDKYKHQYPTYQKQWWIANRERVRPLKRNYDLSRKYGISLTDFNTMVEAQAGKCAICEQEMKPPMVDHCHTTGEIRGLLCSNCNFAIGLFADKPERLYKAICYLGIK